MNSVSRREGFTLIEVMAAIAIAAILAGMAVPVAGDFLKGVKQDGALQVAVDVLAQARDTAIAQRRNYEFAFIGTTRIQVSRVEVPSNARTLVRDAILEAGQQFQKFPSLPDTPDHFGSGAAAIQFTGTGPWMFTTDGSLIDSNGDTANGTIFLGVPNQTTSARAVTVFGATGLVRKWKWEGRLWAQS